MLIFACIRSLGLRTVDDRLALCALWASCVLVSDGKVSQAVELVCTLQPWFYRSEASNRMVQRLWATAGVDKSACVVSNVATVANDAEDYSPSVCAVDPCSPIVYIVMVREPYA